MLKLTLIVLAISLSFFSCTEVVFDAPQPPGTKNLKEIPLDLQGSYSFVVLNEQESIHITSDYFDGDEGKKYLSDSLILRKMDDKYVINQLIKKEGDTKGMWSVYTFEPKGCGFLKATAFIVSEDEYVSVFSEAYNGELVGAEQEKQIIVHTNKAKTFRTIANDRGATLGIILEKLD